MPQNCWLPYEGNSEATRWNRRARSPTGLGQASGAQLQDYVWRTDYLLRS